MANLSASAPNLALNNLRTVAIVIVVAVHAVTAYLWSSPVSSFRFDDPPYRWQSIPIVDHERWLGFDLFCALQDIYLICLLFFLSGLFVWQSLERKGGQLFLWDRLLRIGLPFALAVGLLMPAAFYPVYRLEAVDPSVAAYWQHWLALPFWPSGPPWFLWVLLAFDAAAAALFHFARAVGDAFGRSIGRIAASPPLFIVAMLTASALAYIPLALIFNPWAWFEIGPISFQLCRPLLYGLYFFAGVGIGAHGSIGQGLLATDGWLARRWRTLLAAAVSSYVLWLGIAGLAARGTGTPSLALDFVQALGFVLSCAAGCLCMLAVFLRFANQRLPLLDALQGNAYGIYLVHYVFVIWLQYALLGTEIFAGVKAVIVFAFSLLLSWASVAAMRRVATAFRIVGSGARSVPKAQ